MDFNITVFAERLRKVRQEKKVTIKEVSEKIGLSPTTITSYELGKKIPSLENAFNIARFFDTSIEWLCGIDNTKKIHFESMRDVAEALVQADDLATGVHFCYDEDESEDIIVPLNDTKIIRFLFDWIKMKNLKTEKVIDEFFYKEWLRVRFSELEKYKVNKNHTDEK